MTYRSLERANAFFYDPARRLAVIRRHGGIFYLSSGVNHLKAPTVLLDIAGRELRERRLVENYTSTTQGWQEQYKEVWDEGHALLEAFDKIPEE